MSDCKELKRLIQVVKELRDPNSGCPWNIKQTHESLKGYLLEETYEVVDAIDKKNDSELREELGDLLLQVVLHAQVADDDKRFDIEDISKDIANKMIRRHPHVFEKDVDANESLANWDKFKEKEKQDKGIQQRSILDGIPKSFPALLETNKITKKVAKKGFDWKSADDVYTKIEEELNEVKEAATQKNPEHLQEELGDLLFAVANLCRKYKVRPEVALQEANQKFRTRFSKMEDQIQKDHKSLDEISFDEWNTLWNQAKKS